MDPKALISLIILYEIVALWFIRRRVWNKRRKAGLAERIALTIVVLLPFVGFPFYAFAKLSPDPHGEDPPEASF